MSQYSKSTFEQHLRGCGAIAAISGPRWPICLAVGEDEHQLYRAARAFRRRFAQDSDADLQVMEAHGLQPHELKAFFEERSLFKSVKPLILAGCENAMTVVADVANQADAQGLLPHPILLQLITDRPVVKMSNLLKPLNKLEISCVTPPAYEAAQVIHLLAAEVGVVLAADGEKFLADALGMNVQVIENELKTLSLCFAGRQEPLRRSDIQDQIGTLREDHAFKLSDYQRRGHIGAACLLVDDLVQRGEAPLALLGLLAKNARSALRVLDGLQRGVGVASLAEDLHLPAPVIKDLVAVARQMGAVRLAARLRAAIAADRSLKSGGGDHSNALAAVLMA